MFDLEARLRAWRQEMSTRLAGRDDILDELENHLREAFMANQKSGLPVEEVWAAALARLGDPASLAPEFAKLPVIRPLRWAPALVVVGLYLLVALGFILPMLVRGFDRPHGALLTAHVLTITLGYMAMLAFGLLSAWLTLHRLIGGRTSQRIAYLRWWGRPFAWTSQILSLAGVILGGFWAQAVLGAFWDNDPREWGGVLVILWNVAVLFLLSRRAQPGRTELLAGLGGNIAIGLAWFVAAALTREAYHSYGLSNGVIAFLTVYFLANVMLIGLALWPFPSKTDAGTVR